MPAVVSSVRPVQPVHPREPHFLVTRVTRLPIRLFENAAGAGNTSFLYFLFRLDRLDRLDRRRKIKDFLRPPLPAEPGRVGPLGGLRGARRAWWQGCSLTPLPTPTPRPFHAIPRAGVPPFDLYTLGAEQPESWRSHARARDRLAPAMSGQWRRIQHGISHFLIFLYQIDTRKSADRIAGRRDLVNG
jgi:hypothetical protein